MRRFLFLISDIVPLDTLFNSFWWGHGEVKAIELVFNSPPFELLPFTVGQIAEKICKGQAFDNLYGNAHSAWRLYEIRDGKVYHSNFADCELIGELPMKYDAVYLEY